MIVFLRTVGILAIAAPIMLLTLVLLPAVFLHAELLRVLGKLDKLLNPTESKP